MLHCITPDSFNLTSQEEEKMVAKYTFLRWMLQKHILSTKDHPLEPIEQAERTIWAGCFKAAQGEGFDIDRAASCNSKNRLNCINCPFAN